MKNIVVLFVSAVLLSACASVELPQDPEGVDEMRISPCVCNQLDYKGASFKWRA